MFSQLFTVCLFCGRRSVMSVCMIVAVLFISSRGSVVQMMDFEQGCSGISFHWNLYKEYRLC